MSEQDHLFAKPSPSWIEAVWRTIAADRRREALAILAEMGRCALGTRVRDRDEGRRDEPK